MLNLTSFNLSVNEANVFKYFEEISKIPRGSGDMIKIADYCEEFAKTRNLRYVRDNTGNVISECTALGEVLVKA